MREYYSEILRRTRDETNKFFSDKLREKVGEWRYRIAAFIVLGGGVWTYLEGLFQPLLLVVLILFILEYAYVFGKHFLLVSFEIYTAQEERIGLLSEELAQEENARQELEKQLRQSEVVVLQQRIEQLEAQIEQSRPMERTITRGDADRLVGTLRDLNKRPVRIYCTGEVRDSWSYGDQLRTVFERAGWNVDLVGEYMRTGELSHSDGIWLMGDPEIIEQLREALAVANIDTQTEAEEGSEIRVEIGRDPSFEVRSGELS